MKQLRNIPTAVKVTVGAAAAVAAVMVFVGVRAAATFVPNDGPVGYVGQPVASSTDVSSGDAIMYSIDYNASDWSGSVHAFPISSSGGVGGNDQWGQGGAGVRIRNQGARFIATIRPGTNVGTPFRWDSLSTGTGGQRELIDKPNVNAASSFLLNYLRGDRTKEVSAGGPYRSRGTSGLGDIIHSTPVYWDDGTNKTVFVGANDGMLHAIDAFDGHERFAYVPNAVIKDLAALASPNYTHQYTVDGRMDIRKFGGTTILAAALGAGGKGLFALNVTNVNAASDEDVAAKVLWEVTNASPNMADLGYTYGAPVLTTMPDKTTNVLIVGNGYNNTGSGHAVLYILDAATGARLYAMDTGRGTPGSPNGLSSPSLWDSDGDGYKDTAYAGDLDGTMWKFNLKAPGSTPTPLFPKSGTGLAITMAPGLFKHPLGGVMVEFVTGRMLTKADSTDIGFNYAYGIWDGAPATNVTLRDQTLSETVFPFNGENRKVRMATNNVPDWTVGHDFGWRTRLPKGGERVVGDGAYVTGAAFQFFSTNPTINPSSVPPGENWWMQLNALTGGASGSPLFDLNDDSQFDESDQVNDENPAGRFMGGGVRSQLLGMRAAGVDVFQANYDRNGAPSEPTEVITTKVVDGERGVSGGHFDTDFFCYKNCGGGGSNYKTVYDASGVYSYGREYEGDFVGMNYIHVHEYDDIYDRIGLNMRHPSQDRQRLPTATYTSTTTYTPNTPTHKTAFTYPNTATSTSSTVTGKSGGTVPATKTTYVDTAAVNVATYPKTTTVNGDSVVTKRTTYNTTMTVVESLNKSGPNGQGKYRWDEKTTVRKWDTVIETVESYPNTRFKVLVANQAYSPAVKLTIGGAVGNLTGPNAAYNGPVIGYQTSGTLSAATLPVYQTRPATYSTPLPPVPELDPLVLSMPLDAFNLKNWGTGVTRTGLHPIRPQCAGVAAGKPVTTSDEWRNGALTVQIVDDDITDADVTLNVAGKPELGYRLKTTSLNKLVAEYLIYWHHPTGICKGESNWTSSPAQDAKPSTAVEGTYPPLENDPKGVFVPGNGKVFDDTPPVPPPPKVVNNPDGSVSTTVVKYTPLATGGWTETTTTTTTGVPAAGGSIITTGKVPDPHCGDPGFEACGGGPDGEKTPQKPAGRVNWRELQR